MPSQSESGIREGDSVSFDGFNGVLVGQVEHASDGNLAVRVGDDVYSVHPDDATIVDPTKESP